MRAGATTRDHESAGFSDIAHKMRQICERFLTSTMTWMLRACRCSVTSTFLSEYPLSERRQPHRFRRESWGKSQKRVVEKRL